MFQTLLFYFFSAVLIGAALGVIFSRNPVHAVMFLVLAFFNSAVLWLLAEAEFLAIVMVLVYVGAVMVLFLFVVMMLDINVEQMKGGLMRYAPLGFLVAAVMVVELLQVVWLRSQSVFTAQGFVAMPEGYSNTKALGALVLLYPSGMATNPCAVNTDWLLSHTTCSSSTTMTAATRKPSGA